MHRPFQYLFLVLSLLSLGSTIVAAQSHDATETPPIPTEEHNSHKQPPGQRGTAGADFAEGVAVGTIEQRVLDEISGIAASWANPGLFWVHNDSGNPQQEHIFAIDRSGRGVADYDITNATNADWEDIAVGPGPDPDKSYVYVGDIGDNGGRRDIKTLYRVEEPVVGQSGATLRADVIRLRYPDGPRDAETLLVDPLNGDLYVVGKRDRSNRVYRFAAPLRHGTTRTGVEVARIDNHWLTAGDISPDGSRIIIKTTTRNYLWFRGAGESIGEALSREPVKIPVRSEPQGEAVAWDALGQDYYTVSERANQPIYYFQGLNGCGGDNGITASGQNCPNESKDMAFDNNPATKWLTFSATGWIQMDFRGERQLVNRYHLTSANDAPARDPKDWRLLGSNNGSTWVELDRRRNQDFTERFQTRSFTFDNSTPYRIIRLAVDANADADAQNILQVAEIGFENDGTAPDTTAPVITLVGASRMSLSLNEVFNDPGARALDETDGDLSAAVRVSGTVDSSRVGRYTLRYDVSDAAGNAAETVTRTVDVVGEEPSGHRSHRLLANEQLTNRQYLDAPNGNFRFKLQGDGNLVLRNRQNGQALWSSRTAGRAGTRFILQGDANLVLYTAAGQAVWASRTVGTGGRELVLHNNGALVLYAGGTAVWSVNGNPPSVAAADSAYQKIRRRKMPAGSYGALEDPAPADNGWTVLEHRGFDDDHTAFHKGMTATGESYSYEPDTTPPYSDSPGRYNLADFDELEATLVFKTAGLGDGDQLYVETWDGDEWVVLDLFQAGTDFINHQPRRVTVAFDTALLGDPADAELRLRVEGSNDTDQISLEAVSIRAR